MGLGAPEILLLLCAFIFPVWGYRAGSKRTIGGVLGLLLGFFLNFIGIIIIYFTPLVQDAKFYNFPQESAADELQKFKNLLDNGAITVGMFKYIFLIK
jgi:hypothetical protein